ncbi:hypothetical protein NQ318_003330 [Aromia moschata]|uniref:Uncharacterized protein n=1 Tax=Aromia moschata TaxID=1265417 RepID=A0AAV8YMS9_9CUCU|nr:hypothetical protein NQ318_003330 [Aromia moschata]
MEQRVNLKFLVKLGKTFTEAYAMLKEVYENECLSRTFTKTTYLAHSAWSVKAFLQNSALLCWSIHHTRPSLPCFNPLLKAVLEAVNAFVSWSTAFNNSGMERCKDRQGEYIEGEN